MTDSVHDLAYLYAIDALHADEHSRFEAHLGTCRRCQAEVEQTRSTVAALADDLAETPPPGLKDAVMAQIRETPQDGRVADVVDLRERRLVRIPGARVLAVAAVAVLVVGLGFSLQIRNDDSSVGDVLAAPDAIETLLSGESNSIRAIWSPERSEIALVADGLGRVSADRTYELWFLQEDGVQRAALFQPDSDGELEVVLDLEDATAIGFGVTIEPSGGSDQPTSEVIFAGTFDGST